MKETTRPTDAKAELTEEEKSALGAKLRLLAGTAGGEVSPAYFQPDGRRIPVDDIVEVQFEASETE